MERTMTVEDKIRRAEEIYYRRKNQSVPIRESITREKPKKKKNIKLFKKLIKQIIICLLIYSIFERKQIFGFLFFAWIGGFDIMQIYINYFK